MYNLEDRQRQAVGKIQSRIINMLQWNKTLSAHDISMLTDSLHCLEGMLLRLGDNEEK